MEPTSPSPDQPFLDETRRRRAELRESMSTLENALAAPVVAGQVRWVQRVQVALVELSGDFREHVEMTEGPDGLYRDLLKTSPRLSDAVAVLTREHALITDQVDDLLSRVASPDVIDDVDGTRDRGTALLGRLVRHRQRGSDLVFEAYEVDLGGET
jgi:hypothetical protein